MIFCETGFRFKTQTLKSSPTSYLNWFFIDLETSYLNFKTKMLKQILFDKIFWFSLLWRILLTKSHENSEFGFFCRKCKWSEYYFYIICSRGYWEKLTRNQFLPSMIFNHKCKRLFFSICFLTMASTINLMYFLCYITVTKKNKSWQKSRLNHQRYSLRCDSPWFVLLLCTHHGPSQCFLTYFQQTKENGVLGPWFLNHIVCCDYASTKRTLLVVVVVVV